jgi:hypothetical protein
MPLNIPSLLDWANKVNTPEIQAMLQQYAITHKLTAEEINQLRDKINWLLQNFFDASTADLADFLNDSSNPFLRESDLPAPITNLNQIPNRSYSVLQDKPTIEDFPERVQTANVSGTFNLDFGAFESFDLTMTGATSFNVINAPVSKVVKMVLSGNFAPSFASLPNVIINGTYNGANARTVIAISVTNNKFDVNL